MTLPNRWLPSMACALLALGLSPGPVLGQAKPEPSPLTPGDLKRPMFDTRTPVYGATDQQAKSANAVVADIDGRAVTLGEVSDAIAELPPSVRSLPFADLFPSVLARLERQQVLVIRAQQQALDEDPVVRRKVKAAADRAMANELLEHEIGKTITEQSLLDRYSKDIANKPGPDEVHLRVIMVPTEAAARAIIAELRSGADFATVAKRSSTDPTASAGGDLGFLAMEGLNAEVGSVAFSMQPGQFTPYPFRTSAGWFIAKVEERRAGRVPTFAESREQLRQTLLRDGVDNVIIRAMGDITIREFNLNGKEVAGDIAK
jgi:peptidyl-prolyl cis-trans isomerase C